MSTKTPVFGGHELIRQQPVTSLWRRKRANRSPLTLLVLLVLVTLTACGFYGVDRVTGSGNLVTETRELGSFTRIDVRGGANVELTVDPNLTQSVSVTYDDNIIGFIVTEVAGDTLVIDTRGSFSTTGGLRRVVVIETDDIEVITARDGADLIGNGTTHSYRLRAADGSDVDLLDLQASLVEIDASGGTDVWVFASESITVDASGAADVKVFGSPANVKISESGAADVTLRD